MPSATSICAARTSSIPPIIPKAVFESTSVKMDGDKAKIVGNLTLHGVTKEVTIDAERVGGGDDPWGGYRQGFVGTTRLPSRTSASTSIWDLLPRRSSSRSTSRASAK